MPKLIVIADDLTGACDAGVQFSKKGVPTFVTPDINLDLSHWLGKFEVVVVDTETRHLGAAEAAARVKSVATRGLQAGVRHFYKKVDSTLRGNLGSEVGALLLSTGCRSLPLVPASPEMRRTTSRGFHYVDGRLLHETTFANDPLSAVTGSYIPDILNRQASLRVHVVKAAALKRPPPGVLVFDAETDDELRQVAEVLKRQGLVGVLAGSAGLAAQLPDLLGLKSAPVNTPRFPERMLVVNGSLHVTSLAQVARAKRDGLAVVTLTPEVLVPAGGAESRPGEQAVAEAAAHHRRGADVVLTTALRPDQARASLLMAERAGLPAERLHLRVSENLGRVAARVIGETGIRLTAVFGGETLACLARALRLQGMVPGPELLPGVAVSETVGGEADLLLLTKPGGFGPEDVLRRIMTSIRRATDAHRDHNGRQ